jgi:hypothetical protein
MWQCMAQGWADVPPCPRRRGQAQAINPTNIKRMRQCMAHDRADLPHRTPHNRQCIEKTEPHLQPSTTRMVVEKCSAQGGWNG